MNNKIKVAVLGCTGYTGLELIYLLSNHSDVLINFLGSSSNKGKKISSFDKRLKNIKFPKIDNINEINYIDYNVVFLALPHNISQNIIKDNFNKSIFIDLSADFRLDNQKIYEKNYNNKHLCPKYLKNFTYGLAEINHSKIKKSKHIAVPGCYPTSILIPLIPLLKKNIIKSSNLIIDSKSGYSGAGKNFDMKNIFKDDQINFYNYNTNKHRHMCEIKQELEKVTKSNLNFSFNPHILPIYRGIMSTMYCDLNKKMKKKDIIEFLKDYYKQNIFIKILDDKDRGDFFNVQNTNNCLIKVFENYDNNKIILISLIDNLIKGAAGQAIQCMNLIFDINEIKGLKFKKSA